MVSCTKGDHAICGTCFAEYVNGICEHSASVEIPLLSASERIRFGRVFCPCASTAAGGCASGAFEDIDVAKGLASDVSTFASYMHMRSRLTIADEVSKVYETAQQALQEEIALVRQNAAARGGSNVSVTAASANAAGNLLLAKQLKQLMPGARQCQECGWGPMAFVACKDLSAHHGMQVATVTIEGDDDDEGADARQRSVKIDNSCPRCGWFAKNRNAWPKWDGKIHEDILLSAWETDDKAARLWYPKVAAAEKRAKEALEKVVAGEIAAHALQAELSQERAARRSAEQEFLEARKVISSHEIVWLSASARLNSQLQRERMLRKNLEAALHAESHHASSHEKNAQEDPSRSPISTMETPEWVAHRAFLDDVRRVASVTKPRTSGLPPIDRRRGH